MSKSKVNVPEAKAALGYVYLASRHFNCSPVFIIYIIEPRVRESCGSLFSRSAIIVHSFSPFIRVKLCQNSKTLHM